MMAADLGVKLNIINSEWATAVAGIEARQMGHRPGTVYHSEAQGGDRLQRELHHDRCHAGNPSRQSKGADYLAAFNRPEVVFAVPSGSWSKSVAKEVAPKATLKGFGQSTSADLIRRWSHGRPTR